MTIRDGCIKDRLLVFSGRSNPALTRDICALLAPRLDYNPAAEALLDNFSDGELHVKILDNVRGADVYIVQSTGTPCNDNLMELLVMIDACKRASARRITAVIPYFGYARQDRKDQPRVPITAKLVANILVAAGVDRLLTIDFHTPQLQGFFDIPVDHLYAMEPLVAAVQKMGLSNVVVVAPDTGSVKRARAYAKLLGAGPLAIIDKRRPKPNQSEIYHIVGEVAGLTAVISDDLIDTGGTLVNAVEALLQKGATEVYACCTHGVLSGKAPERIQNSRMSKLVVTDTIDMSKKDIPKMQVASAAGLLADAIYNIHEEQSVGALFPESVAAGSD